MALNFNSKGYLHQTVSLTYEEFVTHFGNNARRKRQIDNAIAFFMSVVALRFMSMGVS
jgi:hypothetical protein